MWREIQLALIEPKAYKLFKLQHLRPFRLVCLVCLHGRLIGKRCLFSTVWNWQEFVMVYTCFMEINHFAIVKTVIPRTCGLIVLCHHLAIVLASFRSHFVSNKLNWKIRKSTFQFVPFCTSSIKFVKFYSKQSKGNSNGILVQSLLICCFELHSNFIYSFLLSTSSDTGIAQLTFQSWAQE